MNDRRTECVRVTRETDIRVILDLDGGGQSSRIETGLGFLDHMLTALSLHAGFDLELTCRGDLEVDDHHTVEDCALVLGQAIDEALGSRAGINRYGSAYVPMDEALARCVVDFSGRPCAVVDLGLRREQLGAVSCENLDHFFRSMAVTMRATLHVDVLRGENDHHRAEAAFKATARALREAVAVTKDERVLSTKGVL